MVDIMPYQYLSTCDIYPCNNRAEYAIGRRGEPPNTYFLICKECLAELLKRGIALMPEVVHGKENEIDNSMVVQNADDITIETPEENSKALQDMTLFELRNLAKEKGIRGYTRLSRKELIKVLEGVET